MLFVTLADLSTAECALSSLPVYLSDHIVYLQQGSLGLPFGSHRPPSIQQLDTSPLLPPLLNREYCLLFCPPTLRPNILLNLTASVRFLPTSSALPRAHMDSTELLFLFSWRITPSPLRDFSNTTETTPWLFPSLPTIFVCFSTTNCHASRTWHDCNSLLLPKYSHQYDTSSKCGNAACSHTFQMLPRNLTCNYRLKTPISECS